MQGEDNGAHTPKQFALFVREDTEEMRSPSEDGWVEDDDDSSAWSDEDDSIGNRDEGAMGQDSISTNLCTILRNAVLPISNGFSSSSRGATVLTLEQMKKPLLLTELDFKEEKRTACPALEICDAVGATATESNAWFKFIRYKSLAETHKLDTILKTLHAASTDQVKKDKDKDMVLTCGIGVIRKKFKPSESVIINCPLLEVDLFFSDCTRDMIKLSPECSSENNTVVRLCPSLSKFEHEDTDQKDHTMQIKAQKILDQFVKSKRKVPINPFDRKTYRSLVYKIGRVLDGTFGKSHRTSSAEHLKHLLIDPKRQDIPEKLKIYDTWIIFQRQKPDSSKDVSQDVQRFLTILSDPKNETHISRLWKPICLKPMCTESTIAFNSHDNCSMDTGEFLLPLKQNSDQLAILKRLEANDCVVVQGPPGTGKTHTIGESFF